MGGITKQLVNGLGGVAGYGEGYLAPNDDDSAFVSLGTTFTGGLNFFGNTYTGLYVNNNGNITFTGPLYEYTPYQITGGAIPMVAAFFGDVDTSNIYQSTGGSNLVYYDVDPVTRTVTATWDHVGYYAANNDKQNSFQIQLTDSGDGAVKIIFRYQDINWTTGDESGGINGLGGTVARVGYTAGDGVNYLELSQSGDQAAILALDTEKGNTGIAGVWEFTSRSGGPGNDVIDQSGSKDDEIIYGGGGNDTIVGGSGGDTLFDGPGNDVLDGGKGDDVYVLTDNNNTIKDSGGAGDHDTVIAGFDIDLSAFPTIENLELTGSGNFHAAGNSANNEITGNSGDNQLDGGAGNDTIAGGLGNDSIDGGVGNNLLDGGKGNDTLVAVGGKDTIQGGEGNDSISAGAGDDKLYGGASDDLLNGGVGADAMEGGEGSDTYYVDNTKDKVTEVKNVSATTSSTPVLPVDIGSSIDTVIASIKYTLGNYVENLTLTGTGNLAGTGNTESNTLMGNTGNNALNGKVGNDSLDGGAGNDSLTGDVGNDTLVGGDGIDKLTGGAGNDSLDGGAGNDTLAGDAGADTLTGGPGADKLTGGADADVFVFDYLNTTAAGADTITDFTEVDELIFDPSVFTALSGGISAGNLVIGSEAKEGDDYLIFDSKTGFLYYDADGAGGEAKIKVAGIKGSDAKATTFAIDDMSIIL